MSYFYDGHSRLALFFANPNHDGCLHVLAVFVLLAFAAYLLRRKRTLHLVCGLFCGIGAMAAAAFVALTYSRGSYVSLLVASLAASAGTVWRERRHSPCAGLVHYLRHFWLPAAFLLLVLCAIPGGGRRMATMASPAADLSIANRLCLWRGGTVVLARNWLHGLGVDCPQPAEGYSLWLQPAEKHEVYRTFVSDVLTNSVRLGLPTYGLLLAWCLWGCLAMLDLWRRCGRTELLWLLCSVAAFLLCGVFNTCTDETLLRNLFLTLMAAVWGIVLLDRFKHGQAHLRRNGVYALCASALFCMALFGAGLLAERLMPYRASQLPRDARDHLSEITLTPRQTTASRRVLFFADNLEEHARTLLVPLASRGVYVQAVRCAGGVDSIDELRRQIADDGPLEDTVVVAAGSSAPNAVCAALGSLSAAPLNSCAIFFGLDMNHPMPELTPQLGRLALPVIVFTDEPGTEGDAQFLPCDETLLLKAVSDASESDTRKLQHR